MKSILIVAALVGFGAGWILKPGDVSESPSPKGIESSRNPGPQAGKSSETLAWSRPQIESLAAGLRNQLHPVKRKILIDQILEGMNAENADAIRQALSPMYYPDRRFIAFYQHWGQLAGADVINLFGGKPKLMIFTGWSQADPMAARDWAREYESGENKLDPAFHSALVMNLGKVDPAEATTHYFAHLNKVGSSGGGLRAISDHVRETRGMKGWVAWAETLPNEGYRQSYFNKIARGWIKEDFASACQWAGTLKGEEGKYAVASVARHWKNKEGYDWSLSLQDETLRTSAIKASIQSWLIVERDEAMDFLNQLEPSSNKDLALHASIYQAKFSEFETGLDWVSQISDPTIRDKALGDWAFHWYIKDPKVADRWIDQSHLSEEAKESYHKFKDSAR